MKFLVPFLLLLTGILLGYFIGSYQHKSEPLDQVVAQTAKVKVIHDTIVETEIVEVVKNVVETKNIILNDTIPIDSNQITIDTLLTDMTSQDSIVDTLNLDENIKILIDQKLKSIQIPIQYISQTTTIVDSLLKETLNIKTVDNEFILVEFWQSPINYHGYKLSKSKLIVYGLSPQHDYKIYKLDDMYFLRFLSINYQLTETENFTSYQNSEIYIK